MEYKPLIEAVATMRRLQSELREARKKNLERTARTLRGLAIEAENKVDRMIKNLIEENNYQVKMF